MSIAAICIAIGLSGLVFSIVTFALGVITGVVLTRSCLTKSTATLNDADIYEDMGGAGVGGVVGGAGAGVGGAGAGVGGAGVTNGPAVYEDVSLHPLEGPTRRPTHALHMHCSSIAHEYFIVYVCLEFEFNSMYSPTQILFAENKIDDCLK